MKSPIKKIGVVSLLVLGAYFAAYYLAVRTMEFNQEHGLIVPAPV